MLTPQNNRNWDKGLVLSLSYTGIQTSYVYTPVTIPPANGQVTPSGASSVQYSGQARNIGLYVSLTSVPGSTITTVTVDVEVAYGNYPATLLATETVVDLTSAANWARVLTQAHQGTGPIGDESPLTFPGAPSAAMGLVTCNRLSELMPKHVRIGVKANAAGARYLVSESGTYLYDTLNVFMVAW